jgi:hypothetical protein
MSYHFPHKTRAEKKQDTIELLRKYVACSCDILADVSETLIIDTPLLKELNQLEILEGEIDWTYIQWRSVVVANGYKQVEEAWIDNISDVSTRDIFKQWTADGEHIFTKNGVTITYKKDISNLWHWYWWDRVVKSWTHRLQLIKDASFDLLFLEKFDDKIYIHEAFLILLGISSDEMDRKEFTVWFNETAPNKFIDYPQIKAYGLKDNYQEFDEWKELKRRFGKGQKDLDIEIDTQTFIKWALRLGYIEEDTHHHRDDMKAPYPEDFTKMLYDLLIEKEMIRGKYDDKWKWLSHWNSLCYLVKELHANQLPMKWHSEHVDRSTVNWTNIIHYVDYPKTGTRLQQHDKESRNGVKNQIHIEHVVDKLVRDYEGDARGRKDS